MSGTLKGEGQGASEGRQLFCHLLGTLHFSRFNRSLLRVNSVLGVHIGLESDLDFTEMILQLGKGRKQANINKMILNVSCNDGKQQYTVVGRNGQPHLTSAFSQAFMIE